MNHRMDLYIVTDREVSRERGHLEMVKRSLAGGADVIQLRDKTLTDRDLLALAREMAVLVRSYEALFIVNDRLDIALAAGADGVHLGQDDLPVSAARAIAPPPFIIGVSVGSAPEAMEAEGDGADYVALSPVFSTPTKKDAGPGRGLEILRAIRSAVSVPIVAIGGIGLHNVEDVIIAGADGVAVISAVLGEEDVQSAARLMKARVLEAKKGR